MSQDKEAVIIRSDDEQYQVKNLLAGKHDKALKFAPQYAALSALVYYDKNESGQNKKILKVLNDSVPTWESINIEFDDFRPSKRGVWLKGLKVVSYFKKENDRIYVTIIFRGTRFTKLRDWYANFNWITRFIPLLHNSYKQILLQINDYIEAIENQLITSKQIDSTENIKFTSAGHSLGGGLAQQAAYASERIETVFAYDSSPVTGYKSVPKKTRNTNCRELKIYRIWEKGEIMIYFRLLTKTARKLLLKPNINPRIVEVRFNFVENKSSLSEHSIINLAMSLIGIQNKISKEISSGQ